jgi:hypothetical protein
MVDPMGQFLATQHLSHDDKGLCILRLGSVSSILLNYVSSLAMQYEDLEEREIILWARDLATFCVWLAEILSVLVWYDLFSIVI